MKVNLCAKGFVVTVFIQRLIKSGDEVFQSNTQFCVGGCGKLEDANNLFMHCDFFGKI